MPCLERAQVAGGEGGREGGREKVMSPAYDFLPRENHPSAKSRGKASKQAAQLCAIGLWHLGLAHCADLAGDLSMQKESK